MPFAAVFELSSLDGTNGFQISGEVTNDQSGWSVASAGDVNGDGFDDLIIGARGSAVNGANSGASYLVFGKASGFDANLNLSTLDGTNGFQMNGEATSDRLGWSVASAGDVNGDGFDDVIVGAYGHDIGGARVNAGASYVVFGKASGFAATLNLSTLDGSNGFQVNGEFASDQSGISVASAGDVNGDGYSDLIIGARAADPNGISSAGISYVVFGKATGFTADLELSSLDGANGFRINGEALSDQSGFCVASAGDVNGDGYADLFVGAYLADPGGNASAGSGYVVFGKASGFTANLDLASLDGSNGFQFDGEAASDFSSRSVALAGDLNGDDFDDLIIGANRADPNGSNSGAAYVIFGKASGFSATLGLSSLDGTNGFKISGEQAGDYTGISVASAGDVNNDGFDDLIIGAVGADTPNSSAGASYVVYGKASGFTANLNLSALDGTNGFKINGELTGDASGRSVASAGDINNDGYGDLIIGAESADPNGNGSGASYVIFGQGTSSGFTGGGGDDSFTGGGTADTISGGGGKDVLDGAGGDDVIDGGDGNDTVSGGAGADDIVGGLGNDVLNGGDGDDVLSDASGSNKLNGGDGDDTITGASGADRLNGENDDDTLDGGAGNDYLDGGTGTNSLTGGTGNDIYIVRSGSDTVIENLGEGTDTVRSMISYTLGDNVEVLELLTGTDINGTGNALNNTLKGNGGANTLSGLAGADKLDGGAGVDILIGGVGRDQLTGGADADTFRVLSESVSQSPLEIDTVTDYQAGTDLLDFSQIDADGNAGNGDTAFSVSLTGLTKVAGQLYAFYTASVATTTVRLDVDGDGKADYQMALKGGDFTADAVGWLL